MELVVVFQNSDGTIDPRYITPYSEWIKGNKNLEMVKLAYGKNLLKILTDDLGYIQLNEQGVLSLKYIIESDPYKTTMRLLGKVAEAIIVNRCNNNKHINRKWATIARKGINKVKSLDKYIAIGTGLKTTREEYPQKYNSSNPQRDIIWVKIKNIKEELL